MGQPILEKTQSQSSSEAVKLADVVKKQAYIAPLDGLRALAILSVLAFHINKDFLPGGFVGVDIFYVISGFIITRNIIGQINNENFTFLEFYKRRFARLFPAAAVTVIWTLIAANFIYGNDAIARVGRSAFYSVLSVANVWFWLNSGYFDEVASQNPLLHMWSLSVEEQFYLFWPALILAAYYLKRARTLALVFLFAFGLAFSWWLSASHPTASFFLTPARVFQFAAGAVFASVGFSAKGLLGTAATVLGLVIIGFSLVFSNGLSYDFLVAALAPAVGSALVLFAIESPVSSLLFGGAMVRWIGLRAYSLYLVHWPLVVFVNGLFGVNRTLFQDALLVLACIGLGDLLHRTVERPLRLHPSHGRDGNAYRVLVAMLLMTVGLTASAHLWALHAGSGTTAAETDADFPVVATVSTPITSNIAAAASLSADSHNEGSKGAPDTNVKAPKVSAGANPDADSTKAGVTAITVNAAERFWANKKKGNFVHRSGLLWVKRRELSRVGAGCQLKEESPVSEFPEQECLRRGTAGKKILILGDSFGPEAYITLTRIIPESRIAAAGAAGCAPYYPEPHWNTRSASCQELNVRRFQWANEGDFAAILLAANWKHWTPRDMDSAFQYLKALGKPVLIYGTRSLYSEKIPDLLDSAMGPSVASDLSRYLRDNMNDKKAELQSALQRAGLNAYYLPISELLCYNGCPAYTPTGEIIYLDTAHISAEAALYIGDILNQGEGADIRRFLDLD